MIKLPKMVDTVKKLIYSPRMIGQIFVSNARSYNVPSKNDVLDLMEAKRLLDLYQKKIIIHTALMNQITSSNPYVVDKTRQKLLYELDVGVMLGCGGIVHFGYVPDLDENLEKGIRESAETLGRVSAFYFNPAFFIHIWSACTDI